MPPLTRSGDSRLAMCVRIHQLQRHNPSADDQDNAGGDHHHAGFHGRAGSMPAPVMKAWAMSVFMHPLRRRFHWR